MISSRLISLLANDLFPSEDDEVVSIVGVFAVDHVDTSERSHLVFGISLIATISHIYHFMI